jgi:hypothetical protein
VCSVGSRMREYESNRFVCGILTRFRLFSWLPRDSSRNMSASNSLVGLNILCHCRQHIINTYACHLSDATDMQKTHTLTQILLFDPTGSTHTSHKLNGDSPFSIASVCTAYGDQYDAHSWNGILHAIRSGCRLEDYSTSLASSPVFKRGSGPSK